MRLAAGVPVPSPNASKHIKMSIVTPQNTKCYQRRCLLSVHIVPEFCKRNKFILKYNSHINLICN